MNSHSIFSRQWWAVSVRLPNDSNVLPKQRLEKTCSNIARAVGGQLWPEVKYNKSGVVIASTDSSLPDGRNGALVGLALLQTQNVYFPLAEGDLETGIVPLTEIQSCQRDFPRKLGTARNPLFQYPLLVAIAPSSAVLVLSSPYYLMLRDLVESLAPARAFSSCIGIDVEHAFTKLKGVSTMNGELTVRSGRMVITGIDNLRSAVFSGDNVIASPLYSELVDRPNASIHPKDCRLRRTYSESVGGNRRPFVSWFDSHGNFRFTPGCEPTSSLHKFLDLLLILADLRLVRNAETFNPLSRIGPNAEPI